jgi:hypothetical protein
MNDLVVSTATFPVPSGYERKCGAGCSHPRIQRLMMSLSFHC